MASRFCVKKAIFCSAGHICIVTWLCEGVYVCVSHDPHHHTGGAMGPLLTGVLANHEVGGILHVVL